LPSLGLLVFEAKGALAQPVGQSMSETSLPSFRSCGHLS
jgi:hypothetical protein